METEISRHLFKATKFMVICYPAKKTNILTSINIEKDWHSRPEQESPWIPIFSSVQFSRSVMSDSLQCHELQHTRPPCSSPTPGVYPNPCSSSWWCHPAISSSVVPFSSYPQSLPESGSFPMSQLFTWGGQSIGVSALASVLPVNTQDWSPYLYTYK